MPRVVVTGIGMVSSIGHEREAVVRSLLDSRSGVSYQAAFAEAGMASQVAGVPDVSGLPQPPRRLRRFMGDAALYGWLAASRAIADAGLTSVMLQHPRTGLIIGSGVGGARPLVEMHDVQRERGVDKVLPYAVPQIMGSTVSANLASAFGILGVSYGLTSACATSAHCIGHAAEQIQLGKQDIMLCGGSEEVGWHSAMLFDAMGVLSRSHKKSPQHASRPYDSGRDGFVIAGGAAVLVLESLEHARARHAPILAEVAGYGATSDGAGMVNPTGDGALRAMRLAVQDFAGSVDYINTHATGTEQGDMVEVAALRELFGEGLPPFSSTKGLTGHAIAASGALEACFSLLMMEHGFMAASANIDLPDPALSGLPILLATRHQAVDSVLCNSFGFGGTNASLLFSRAYL
ncbi:beta-ketoacyl synthase N-terminal-like domain-containing protein [Paludibacterium yongneupense]|uniref:beta-ketoacyl synthase N-terminal-like domain-containing protein n=1 Tax=Paludibacterium yongneupense TaxID=400061 RepID=UPI00041BD8D5|nr:beta-ketoacyl synthase N-terminal-like domain-containing protein [Paludibacterium yongneupense]